MLVLQFCCVDHVPRLAGCLQASRCFRVVCGMEVSVLFLPPFYYSCNIRRRLIVISRIIAVSLVGSSSSSFYQRRKPFHWKSSIRSSVSPLVNTLHTKSRRSALTSGNISSVNKWSTYRHCTIMKRWQRIR